LVIKILTLFFMKTSIFLLVNITLFFTSSFYAQKPQLLDGKYSHFSLHTSNDTIDFVVVDSLLQTKKPVFLFCQGSLPYPLFFKSEDSNEPFFFGGGLSNFDLKTIKQSYHVVVISMPKTPLYIGPKNLGAQHCYVPDTTNPYVLSTDFYQADQLDNYVKRANSVIKFLRKQDWVAREKLVIAGHSQGSHIAVKLAHTNKHVTCLGLFGFDPFGRYEKLVRQIRKDAMQHKISWKEADSLMQEQYMLAEEVMNPQIRKDHPSTNAWYSFANPSLDVLMKLTIPIYIANGTHDNSGELSDYLPLYFIRARKHNLIVKRYFDMEHNFFEVDQNQQVDYTKPHWKEVMNAFVEWTRTK
jgi:pimeloyl-ACP methyl ester carboxylesterase